MLAIIFFVASTSLGVYSRGSLGGTLPLCLLLSLSVSMRLFIAVFFVYLFWCVYCSFTYPLIIRDAVLILIFNSLELSHFLQTFSVDTHRVF